MVQPDDEIAEQIARIRSEVERTGGATIGGEVLRKLCPDHLTISEQFLRIASIAHAEGWSFAFLGDGTVRFGSYAEA